jgi:hypothetical protein
MRAFIVSPAATALLALGDAAVPSKLREPALVAVVCVEVSATRKVRLRSW